MFLFTKKTTKKTHFNFCFEFFCKTMILEMQMRKLDSTSAAYLLLSIQKHHASGLHHKRLCATDLYCPWMLVKSSWLQFWSNPLLTDLGKQQQGWLRHLSPSHPWGRQLDSGLWALLLFQEWTSRWRIISVFPFLPADSFRSFLPWIPLLSLQQQPFSHFLLNKFYLIKNKTKQNNKIYLFFLGRSTERQRSFICCFTP